MKKSMIIAILIVALALVAMGCGACDMRPEGGTPGKDTALTPMEVEKLPGLLPANAIGLLVEMAAEDVADISVSIVDIMTDYHLAVDMPGDQFLLPLEPGDHTLAVNIMDEQEEVLFSANIDVTATDIDPHIVSLNISGNAADGYSAALVRTEEPPVEEVEPEEPVDTAELLNDYSKEQQLSTLAGWDKEQRREFAGKLRADLNGEPEQIAIKLTLIDAASWMNQGVELVDYDVFPIDRVLDLQKDFYLYELSWGLKPADPDWVTLAGAVYIDPNGYIRDDRRNSRIWEDNGDGTYTDKGSPAFDMSLQQGLKAILDYSYEGDDYAVWAENEYRFTAHSGDEHPAGYFAFTLGRVFGLYPWGNDPWLEIDNILMTATDMGGMDFYRARLEGTQGFTELVWYMVRESERRYIYSVTTTEPSVYVGPIGCGMNRERLLNNYPVTERENFEYRGPEQDFCPFDQVYSFIDKDYSPDQEVRFYLLDGVVNGIEMFTVID